MQSEHHSNSELTSARRTLILICSLAGPLFLAIVGVKLYKMEFALFPVSHTFEWQAPTLHEFLRRVIRAPLTNIAAAMALPYLIFRQIRNRQRKYAALFCAIAVALIFRGAINGIGAWEGEQAAFPHLYSITRIFKQALNDGFGFLNFFRSDLKFIAIYIIVIYMLCAIWPTLHMKIFRCFVAINISLLLFAGIELWYYMKTGITAGTGDFPIFIYLLKNMGDLWPIIKGEFDYKIGVLLFVLAVTAAAPLLIEHVFARSRAPLIETRNQLHAVLAGCYGVMAVLLIAAPTEKLDLALFKFSGNTFTTLGYGAVEAIKTANGMALGGSGPSTFDVASIEFASDEKVRAGRKLNVVIIMLESMRARSTGLYNASLHNTPFLNELGKKSLKVEDMYAVVPRTSGAWVSVLHGTYSSTNTVMARWAEIEASKPGHFSSLPRLLSRYGYKSAFFIPTHLNYENEGLLLTNMGFDRVMTDKDYNTQGFERSTYFGYEDRVMLKPIAAWLDEQNSAKTPFFLTVMTNVGHAKYEFPKYWQPKPFVSYLDENNYLNCIEYIDDFLRQLFSVFADRQLLESTVFLIFGDHGDSFGEHGIRLRAMTLYEDETKIPMLIFAPSLFPDGGVISGPRQQINILPTVADVLGLKIVEAAFPERPCWRR